MINEQVILVDDNDVAIGECEKLEAHKKGLLHRAFSIFIVNEKGEMLLQQRAKNKYHSGGLWTNACCGHPRPGEDITEAAIRRLKEEMGIVCTLRKKFTFKYKAIFENGLTEHEVDHVFVGVYKNQPRPNEAEVMQFMWKNMDWISEEINSRPTNFTVWFKSCMKRGLH